MDGSRSPLRMAVTIPARGIRPIFVSTLRPPMITAMPAPFPRRILTDHESTGLFTKPSTGKEIVVDHGDKLLPEIVSLMAGLFLIEFADDGG
jgi:hypothetical protein